MNYTIEYIRQALASDDISQPDYTKAGKQDVPVLEIIYNAHCGGGHEAAHSIYKKAITRMRPDLANLDTNSNGNGNGNGDGDEQPFERDINPDDDMLAVEIAASWDNQIAFLHGDWHQYVDGCWKARHAAEIQQQIRIALRGWRWLGVKVSQSRIKSLVAMLEADVFKPDRDIIDTAGERAKYVPLKNGLFNVETMELEEHRPELYFTHQLPFDYDPMAKCPQWLRFLETSLVYRGTEEPDYDMIMFTQEAMAYSMTARTDMKVSFWLYGAGDSGKSTLLSVLRALMGDFHSTIDLNNLGGNRFMLSGIVGKRVVSFTEADQGAVLPDGLYKALVGGSDEIFADVKNKAGITFRPEAKLWWAMNNQPRNTDRSGALTRRLEAILFNRTIPKHQRIENLDARLARELPGIFNWLKEGYERLVQQGAFTEVAQASEWKENYIRENDTELNFVEELLEADPRGRIASKVLYESYRSWCDENGFKSKNIRQVSKDWERLGMEKVKSSGVHTWCGFRFISEEY